MKNSFDDLDLDRLYDQVQELREQVKNSPKAMEYYNYLKEINKNDQLYGWLFNNNDILEDTPEDLDLYQKPYIKSVLCVYKGELESILNKIEL